MYATEYQVLIGFKVPACCYNFLYSHVHRL